MSTTLSVACAAALGAGAGGWTGDGISVSFAEAAFAAGPSDFAPSAGRDCADSPAPLSSTVRIACPTLTLAPALTLISLTLPATDEGTSIVALSVSSSRTG